MPQKVNAIANGYAVLKSLAIQEAEQGVTEIAKSTGISPSSCFNILRTLVDLDLATFDAKTKGYSIGPGIFELARKGLMNDSMLAAAQPILVTLAHSLNATLSLWDIVNDSEAVLLALGQNSSPARLQLQIGSRQAIGAGATGRAALSIYDKNKQWMKDQFKKVHWQGEISFKEYMADVDRAKEVGYAIDRDKYYLGISTVSAAFIERKTGKRYCLTAVLLSGAHDDESINSVGNDLKSAAMKLKNLSL